MDMSILINKKSIVFGLISLAIFVLGVITLPGVAKAQNYIGGSDVAVVEPRITSVTQGSISQKGITNLTIIGSNFMPGSIVRLDGSDYSSFSTNFIDSSHLSVKLDLSKISVVDPIYISVVNPASYFVGGSKYSNAISFKVSAVPNANPNAYNNNSNGYNTYSNSTNGNNGSNGSANNYNNSLFSYTNTGDSSKNTNGSYYSNENQNGNNSNGKNVGSLAAGAIFGSNSFAPSGIIQWILFAIIILLLVIIVRKFFGGADRYHSKPLKHA